MIRRQRQLKLINNRSRLKVIKSYKRKKEC